MVDYEWLAFFAHLATPIYLYRPSIFINHLQSTAYCKIGCVTLLETWSKQIFRQSKDFLHLDFWIVANNHTG